MGAEGNIDLSEEAEEMKEYLQEDHTSYGEFKDRYGRFKAVGLTQGPSSVVREEDREIHVGDADLESVASFLDDYIDAHKPSKIRAAWSIGTMGIGGAGVLGFLQTGNTDYLIAGGVFLLAGKDEAKETSREVKEYFDLKRAKAEAVNTIENSFEDLDNYQVIYNEDVGVPEIGINPEQMIGAIGMEDDYAGTGPAFQ